MFRLDRAMSTSGAWVLGLIVVSAVTCHSEEPWKELFNGKDLAGWVSINVAPDTFTAREGMIVSTGFPTGMLRTDRMYENFVIELEWRHMKPGGNAGLFLWGDGRASTGIPFARGIEVQILDNAFDIPGKNEWFTTHGDIFPVHGARMNPVGRIAQSGVRSFPTEEHSKSSPEWNHYRVVANDGNVELSVNGILVTRGESCWPRKGYICLESEGSECHFRNIRIQELPSTGATESETAWSGDGFVPLFTGIDFRGWKIPQGDGGHWKIVDEVIDYDAESEADGEKSLWSEQSYRDFELIVDWRIKETPYVNPNAYNILPNGDEESDERGVPIKIAIPDSDSGIFLRGDGKFQVNIWCWPVGSGEMYGVRTDRSMPADVRASVTPKQKADHPIGEWNRFEITVRGSTVTVDLNGVRIVESAPIPGMPGEGPIALQHHGAKRDGQWTSPPSLVQFRNVMIRELNPE